MGWSLGYDSRHGGRDIGYGVPAYCDHPQCWAEIDRGLGCVCGSDAYGGERGCGLYFCGHHLSGFQPQLCPRCRNRKKPYAAKVDHPDWKHHKRTDPSWQKWRAENPAEAAKL